MLRQRYVGLLACAVLPLLGGCVQATRHSNTMVFGTNTSLAAKIGTGVNQVPELSVGYSRQEAVIMPLLANTADADGKLVPCGTKEVDGEIVTSTITDSPGVPHPCKFVATKTDSNGIISQDSYSVLASFGANVKARAPGPNSTNSDIGIGLAQYFATGVAAQLLAANGGAAVVSVSEAAKESAISTKTGAATAAVTGTNLAASLIEDEATLQEQINGPWACGNPATDRANFSKIVAHAGQNLPDGSWVLVAPATTITQARTIINGLSITEIEQFVKSKKAVCGG